jgi:hypothetical protein
LPPVCVRRMVGIRTSMAMACILLASWDVWGAARRQRSCV